MEQKLSDSGLLKQQAFFGAVDCSRRAACWRCTTRRMAAGLCHSDLSVINGDPRPMPMVLGRAASRVVQHLGEGVTQLRPGDHMVAFVSSCGHCMPCSDGRLALCDPAPRPTRRLTPVVAELRRDEVAVPLSESDDKHSPGLVGQVWRIEHGVVHAA